MLAARRREKRARVREHDRLSSESRRGSFRADECFWAQAGRVGFVRRKQKPPEWASAPSILSRSTRPQRASSSQVPDTSGRGRSCPGGVACDRSTGVVVVAGLLHEQPRVDGELVVAMVAKHSSRRTARGPLVPRDCRSELGAPIRVKAEASRVRRRPRPATRRRLRRDRKWANVSVRCGALASEPSVS